MFWQVGRPNCSSITAHLAIPLPPTPHATPGFRVFDSTHLLPSPQAVVPLVYALIVRDIVLAVDPAVDCQYQAACGRPGERREGRRRALRRYLAGPAAGERTYPAIVKSGEV